MEQKSFTLTTQVQPKFRSLNHNRRAAINARGNDADWLPLSTFMFVQRGILRPYERTGNLDRRNCMVTQLPASGIVASRSDSRPSSMRRYKLLIFLAAVALLV